jgi:hypothetical protein
MINEFGAVGGMEIDTRKPNYSEKASFIATFPTTDATLPDL